MKYVISFKCEERSLEETFVTSTLQEAYDLITGITKEDNGTFWKVELKPAKEF